MSACSMEAVTDLKIQADDKSFEFLLCNITVSEKLTKLRDRIQELLKDAKYRKIVSFSFTMRNVPIGRRQENSLTLGRIAQNVHGDKLIAYVKPVYADDQSTETINKKEKIESVIPSQPKPRRASESETEYGEEYRVYSDADIKSSEGLELKKRLYWNNRISDFAEEIKSNRVSKFEAYGIIDVEWTRKQTELLRVMADEAILILKEKNLNSTSQSRKSTSHEIDVERAYERLERSDFHLKYSYKRIEDLHKKDDSHKRAESIKHEEENFDKLYTDLKCQQANLKKCLKAFEERDKDKDTTSAVPVFSRYVQESEMQGLVDGIKEDYNVEDILSVSDEEMRLDQTI